MIGGFLVEYFLIDDVDGIYGEHLRQQLAEKCKVLLNFFKGVWLISSFQVGIVLVKLLLNLRFLVDIQI